MRSFAVGDIVRHTSTFLRSVGWFTNVPRNGVVVEVLIVGFMDGWPVVEWCDGPEGPIHPANLE